MKKLLLMILAFSTILSSCSDKKDSLKDPNHKSKMVLGAFYDMVSPSSLDESKLQDLPRIVDLSHIMTPARNQGDRLTCTFFSTIAVIEAAIKLDLGIEVNLSEEYLNYVTKNLGPQALNYRESSVPIVNIYGLYQEGLILEDDWAYQPSWFMPGLKCEDYKDEAENTPSYCYTHDRPNAKALSRKIDTNNILFNDMPKNTNEIIKFLAERKRPLIMAIIVNPNSWDSATGETNYSEELRQQCLENNSLCGAHSVVLTGYDLDKRVFMFKNSYGVKWGKNGYGTIPFDVVDRYVNYDLYYAEIVDSLKIPLIQESEIKIKNLKVSSSMEEDKSIKVNIDGLIENASGKTFYIQNSLMKKSKKYSQDIPNAINAELILVEDLNEKKIIKGSSLSIFKHLNTNGENTHNLTSDTSSELIFSAEMMSIPSIKSLMDANEYDLVLRTTIYSHGDKQGYEFLTSNFSEVK